MDDIPQFTRGETLIIQDQGNTWEYHIEDVFPMLDEVGNINPYEVELRGTARLLARKDQL